MSQLHLITFERIALNYYFRFSFEFAFILFVGLLNNVQTLQVRNWRSHVNSAKGTAVQQNVFVPLRNRNSCPLFLQFSLFPFCFAPYQADFAWVIVPSNVWPFTLQ